MREQTVQSLSASGFHSIGYTEWGPKDTATAVVCVHGLTRNGRDFDWLAHSLAAAGYRVVCPSVVGRGTSSWLADPAGYTYPQYLADMTALLARLDTPEVLWVGTSMGGLIGMMLAAQPGTPIRRLVMNDVGPFVPKEALERIGTYVGTDPVFEDVAGVEAYLRFIYPGFGPLSDDRWQHMARHSARLRPDGRWGLAYDPGIGNVFKTGHPIADVNLWMLWDRIACPTLVLRGADSELLLPETAAEMTQRGPKARLVEVPLCAHAPSLMVPEQIAEVQAFLTEG